MNTGADTLKVSKITKIYSDEFGTKRKVLEDISFEINNSSPKMMSILAPFGGGKSTLLRIIAGIEKPSDGDIILNAEKYLQPNGKLVLIPEKSPSLPWLNVKENIELACRLDTCRKKAGSVEINDLIGMVGLSGYENHYPHNSSLGFRFRISLARALLFNPFVLLLDDCFKKMDAVAREEMYELLKFVLTKVDTSFLLATTNILEAVRLSGKIFLMGKDPGKILNEINVSEDSFENYSDYGIQKYIKLIESAYDDKILPGSINFSI
ncbi:MAG TPA: ATP-binding cassette domain-containing protein [Ignavibacteriaceae bacterium]|nr:ATP-binding cassette domain-containing protein [Ignavibacteriaceae bacterium]